MAGTPTKVTALISVAMIDPLTAYQGSFRPPRKKSRMVACLPASLAPTAVVTAKYRTTTVQSMPVK